MCHFSSHFVFNSKRTIFREYRFRYCNVTSVYSSEIHVVQLLSHRENGVWKLEHLLIQLIVYDALKWKMESRYSSQFYYILSIFPFFFSEFISMLPNTFKSSIEINMLPLYKMDYVMSSILSSTISFFPIFTISIIIIINENGSCIIHIHRHSLEKCKSCVECQAQVWVYMSSFEESF